MVVVTGDLTETKAAFLPGVLSPLADFNAPAFFVEGNHETYSGIEQALSTIGKQNLRSLHNEIVNTHGIQLIGLDYLNADENTFDMHPSENKNTVKSVMAEMKLNSEIPAILISHSPAGAQYAAEAGVDLVISGHTHNGQIFPFSLIAKLAFPFPGGLYSQPTKVFVSSGIGGIFARMRLGSFNEINLLRLVNTFDN
jgi:predicted MPP superfamily phosphohydrolase